MSSQRGRTTRSRASGSTAAGAVVAPSPNLPQPSHDSEMATATKTPSPAIATIPSGPPSPLPPPHAAVSSNPTRPSPSESFRANRDKESEQVEMQLSVDYQLGHIDPFGAGLYQWLRDDSDFANHHERARAEWDTYLQLQATPIPRPTAESASFSRIPPVITFHVLGKLLSLGLIFHRQSDLVTTKAVWQEACSVVSQLARLDKYGAISEVYGEYNLHAREVAGQANESSAFATTLTIAPLMNRPEDQTRGSVSRPSLHDPTLLSTHQLIDDLVTWWNDLSALRCDLKHLSAFSKSLDTDKDTETSGVELAIFPESFKTAVALHHEQIQVFLRNLRWRSLNPFQGVPDNAEVRIAYMAQFHGGSLNSRQTDSHISSEVYITIQQESDIAGLMQWVSQTIWKLLSGRPHSELWRHAPDFVQRLLSTSLYLLYTGLSTCSHVDMIPLLATSSQLDRQVARDNSRSLATGHHAPPTLEELVLLTEIASKAFDFVNQLDCKSGILVEIPAFELLSSSPQPGGRRLVPLDFCIWSLVFKVLLQLGACGQGGSVELKSWSTILDSLLGVLCTERFLHEWFTESSLSILFASIVRACPTHRRTVHNRIGEELGLVLEGLNLRLLVATVDDIHLEGDDHTSHFGPSPTQENSIANEISRKHQANGRYYSDAMQSSVFRLDPPTELIPYLGHSLASLIAIVSQLHLEERKTENTVLQQVLQLSIGIVQHNWNAISHGQLSHLLSAIMQSRTLSALFSLRPVLRSPQSDTTASTDLALNFALAAWKNLTGTDRKRLLLSAYVARLSRPTLTSAALPEDAEYLVERVLDESLYPDTPLPLEIPVHELALSGRKTQHDVSQVPRSTPLQQLQGYCPHYDHIELSQMLSEFVQWSLASMLSAPGAEASVSNHSTSTPGRISSRDKCKLTLPLLEQLNELHRFELCVELLLRHINSEEAELSLAEALVGDTILRFLEHAETLQGSPGAQSSPYELAYASLRRKFDEYLWDLLSTVARAGADTAQSCSNISEPMSPDQLKAPLQPQLSAAGKSKSAEIMAVLIRMKRRERLLQNRLINDSIEIPDVTSPSSPNQLLISQMERRILTQFERIDEDFEPHDFEPPTPPHEHQGSNPPRGSPPNLSTQHTTPSSQTQPQQRLGSTGERRGIQEDDDLSVISSDLRPHQRVKLQRSGLQRSDSKLSLTDTIVTHSQDDSATILGGAVSAESSGSDPTYTTVQETQLSLAELRHLQRTDIEELHRLASSRFINISETPPITLDAGLKLALEHKLQEWLWFACHLAEAILWQGVVLPETRGKGGAADVKRRILHQQGAVLSESSYYFVSPASTVTELMLPFYQIMPRVVTLACKILPIVPSRRKSEIAAPLMRLVHYVAVFPYLEVPRGSLENANAVLSNRSPVRPVFSSNFAKRMFDRCRISFPFTYWYLGAVPESIAVRVPIDATLSGTATTAEDSMREQESEPYVSRTSDGDIIGPVHFLPTLESYLKAEYNAIQPSRSMFQLANATSIPGTWYGLALGANQCPASRGESMTDERQHPGDFSFTIVNTYYRRCIQDAISVLLDLVGYAPRFVFDVLLLIASFPYPTCTGQSSSIGVDPSKWPTLPFPTLVPQSFNTPALPLFRPARVELAADAADCSRVSALATLPVFFLRIPSAVQLGVAFLTELLHAARGGAHPHNALSTESQPFALPDWKSRELTSVLKHVWPRVLSSTRSNKEGLAIQALHVLSAPTLTNNPSSRVRSAASFAFSHIVSLVFPGSALEQLAIQVLINITTSIRTLVSHQSRLHHHNESYQALRQALSLLSPLGSRAKLGQTVTQDALNFLPFGECASFNHRRTELDSLLLAALIGGPLPLLEHSHSVTGAAKWAANEPILQRLRSMLEPRGQDRMQHALSPNSALRQSSDLSMPEQPHPLSYNYDTCLSAVQMELSIELLYNQDVFWRRKASNMHVTVATAAMQHVWNRLLRLALETKSCHARPLRLRLASAFYCPSVPSVPARGLGDVSCGILLPCIRSMVPSRALACIRALQEYYHRNPSGWQAFLKSHAPLTSLIEEFLGTEEVEARVSSLASLFRLLPYVSRLVVGTGARQGELPFHGWKPAFLRGPFHLPSSVPTAFFHDCSVRLLGEDLSSVSTIWPGEIARLLELHATLTQLTFDRSEEQAQTRPKRASYYSCYFADEAASLKSLPSHAPWLLTLDSRDALTYPFLGLLVIQMMMDPSPVVRKALISSLVRSVYLVSVEHNVSTTSLEFPLEKKSAMTTSGEVSASQKGYVAPPDMLAPEQKLGRKVRPAAYSPGQRFVPEMPPPQPQSRQPIYLYTSVSSSHHGVDSAPKAAVAGLDVLNSGRYANLSALHAVMTGISPNASHVDESSLGPQQISVSLATTSPEALVRSLSTQSIGWAGSDWYLLEGLTDQNATLGLKRDYSNYIRDSQEVDWNLTRLTGMRFDTTEDSPVHRSLDMAPFLKFDFRSLDTSPWTETNLWSCSEDVCLEANTGSLPCEQLLKLFGQDSTHAVRSILQQAISSSFSDAIHLGLTKSRLLCRLVPRKAIDQYLSEGSQGAVLDDPDLHGSDENVDSRPVEPTYASPTSAKAPYPRAPGSSQPYSTRTAASSPVDKSPSPARATAASSSRQLSRTVSGGADSSYMNRVQCQTIQDTLATAVTAGTDLDISEVNTVLTPTPANRPAIRTLENAAVALGGGLLCYLFGRSLAASADDREFMTEATPPAAAARPKALPKRAHEHGAQSNPGNESPVDVATAITRFVSVGMYSLVHLDASEEISLQLHDNFIETCAAIAISLGLQARRVLLMHLADCCSSEQSNHDRNEADSCLHQSRAWLGSGFDQAQNLGADVGPATSSGHSNPESSPRNARRQYPPSGLFNLTKAMSALLSPLVDALATPEYDESIDGSRDIICPARDSIAKYRRLLILIAKAWGVGPIQLLDSFGHHLYRRLLHRAMVENDSTPLHTFCARVFGGMTADPKSIDLSGKYLFDARPWIRRIVLPLLPVLTTSRHGGELAQLVKVLLCHHHEHDREALHAPKNSVRAFRSFPSYPCFNPTDLALFLEASEPSVAASILLDRNLTWRQKEQALARYQLIRCVVQRTCGSVAQLTALLDEFDTMFELLRRNDRAAQTMLASKEFVKLKDLTNAVVREHKTMMTEASLDFVRMCLLFSIGRPASASMAIQALYFIKRNRGRFLEGYASICPWNPDGRAESPVQGSSGGVVPVSNASPMTSERMSAEPRGDNYDRLLNETIAEARKDLVASLSPETIIDVLDVCTQPEKKRAALAATKVAALLFSVQSEVRGPLRLPDRTAFSFAGLSLIHIIELCLSAHGEHSNSVASKGLDHVRYAREATSGSPEGETTSERGNHAAEGASEVSEGSSGPPLDQGDLVNRIHQLVLSISPSLFRRDSNEWVSMLSLRSKRQLTLAATILMPLWTLHEALAKRMVRVLTAWRRPHDFLGPSEVQTELPLTSRRALAETLRRGQTCPVLLSDLVNMWSTYCHSLEPSVLSTLLVELVLVLNRVVKSAQRRAGIQNDTSDGKPVVTNQEFHELLDRYTTFAHPKFSTQTQLAQLSDSSATFPVSLVSSQGIPSTLPILTGTYHTDDGLTSSYILPTKRPQLQSTQLPGIFTQPKRFSALERGDALSSPRPGQSLTNPMTPTTLLGVPEGGKRTHQNLNPNDLYLVIETLVMRSLFTQDANEAAHRAEVLLRRLLLNDKTPLTLLRPIAHTSLCSSVLDILLEAGNRRVYYTLRLQQVGDRIRKQGLIMNLPELKLDLGDTASNSGVLIGGAGSLYSLPPGGSLQAWAAHATSRVSLTNVYAGLDKAWEQAFIDEFTRPVYPSIWNNDAIGVLRAIQEALKTASHNDVHIRVDSLRQISNLLEIATTPPAPTQFVIDPSYFPEDQQRRLIVNHSIADPSHSLRVIRPYLATIVTSPGANAILSLSKEQIARLQLELLQLLTRSQSEKEDEALCTLLGFVGATDPGYVNTVLRSMGGSLSSLVPRLQHGQVSEESSRRVPESLVGFRSSTSDHSTQFCGTANELGIKLMRDFLAATVKRNNRESIRLMRALLTDAGFNAGTLELYKSVQESLNLGMSRWDGDAVLYVSSAALREAQKIRQQLGIIDAQSDNPAGSATAAIPTVPASAAPSTRRNSKRGGKSKSDPALVSNSDLGSSLITPNTGSSYVMVGGNHDGTYVKLEGHDVSEVRRWHSLDPAIREAGQICFMTPAQPAPARSLKSTRTSRPTKSQEFSSGKVSETVVSGDVQRHTEVPLQSFLWTLDDISRCSTRPQASAVAEQWMGCWIESLLPFEPSTGRYASVLKKDRIIGIVNTQRYFDIILPHLLFDILCAAPPETIGQLQSVVDQVFDLRQAHLTAHYVGGITDILHGQSAPEGTPIASDASKSPRESSLPADLPRPATPTSVSESKDGGFVVGGDSDPMRIHTDVVKTSHPEHRVTAATVQAIRDEIVAVLTAAILLSSNSPILLTDPGSDRDQGYGGQKPSFSSAAPLLRDVNPKLEAKLALLCRNLSRTYVANISKACAEYIFGLFDVLYSIVTADSDNLSVIQSRSQSELVNLVNAAASRSSRGPRLTFYFLPDSSERKEVRGLSTGSYGHRFALVEAFVFSLPMDLLAQAAFACNSNPRALRYHECFLREKLRRHKEQTVFIEAKANGLGVMDALPRSIDSLRGLLESYRATRSNQSATAPTGGSADILLSNIYHVLRTAPVRSSLVSAALEAKLPPYAYNRSQGLGRDLEAYTILRPEDLKFHQLLASQLQDTDTVKGLAAYRTHTDHEERIVDLESRGHWRDAAAAHEQAISLSLERISEWWKSAPAPSGTSDVINALQHYMGVARCLKAQGSGATALTFVNGVLQNALLAASFGESVTIVQKETTKQIKALGAEACWRLGQWDQLDVFLQQTSEDDEPSFELSIARSLSALHSKKYHEVPMIIANARRRIFDPLYVAAEEGYQRSYPYILQLQTLRDIEMTMNIVQELDSITSLRGDGAGDSTSGEQIPQHNQSQRTPTETVAKIRALLLLWNARAERLPTEFVTRESILALQRVLLTFMKLGPETLGYNWLELARRARDSEQFDIAANALDHAALLNSPEIPFESAALTMARGQERDALEILEREIRLMDIRQANDDAMALQRAQGQVLPGLDGDEASRGGSKDGASGLDHLVLDVEDEKTSESSGKAARALLIGKWIERTKAKDPSVAKEFYTMAVEESPSEEPFYLLGRYFDRVAKGLETEIASAPSATSLAATATLALEFTASAIGNYAAALERGDRFVYQTLPRILTLWIDNARDLTSKIQKVMSRRSSSPSQASNASSGSRGTEYDFSGTGLPGRIPDTKRLEDYMAYISAVIEYLAERLSTYKWYMCLSQIISRFTHESDDIFAPLIQVIIRLLSDYFPQTIWYIGPLSQYSDRRRHQRAKHVLDKFKSHAPMMAQSVDAICMVFGLLKNVCNYTLEQDSKEQRLSLGNVCPELKDLRGVMNLLVPKLSSFVFTLPTTSAPPIYPVKAIWPTQSKPKIRSQRSDLPASLLSAELRRVFSDDLPCIAGFNDEIEIIKSKEKPKKVTIVDTFGKTYGFLCKKEVKGDMRTDARTMDIATVLNGLFNEEASTRARKTCLRTFAVVSLTEDCGIIEWVPETSGLRLVLSECENMIGRVPNYHEMRRIYTNPAESPEDRLRTLCRLYPPLLNRWYLVHCIDATLWCESVRRFTVSCAAWSMVGHILGLGDRHGENVLIDKLKGGTFGDCLHVDFDCLFDKGKTLPTPEIVPFRLTPNIIAVMGVVGIEGTFRCSCEDIMSVIRNNEATLMPMLHAFVNDTSGHAHLTRSKESSRDRDGRAMDQQERIRQWQRDTLDEIEQKIQGRLKPSSAPLSVPGIVHYLIEEAMSEYNLSRMYIGWMPWV